jgi:hypothetical protein
MQSEVQVMVNRADQLINALTDAMMSSIENAAERLRMSSELAQIQARGVAFLSVLEAVGASKQALLLKAKTAAGPMKLAYQQQIKVLSAQETAILAKIGVAPEQARKAIAYVDGQQTPEVEDVA